MTWIAVEKVHVLEVGSASGDTETVTEQIRQLAFRLFESRGGGDGNDLDDWLSAEREFILTPESELGERDGKFEIRIAAAGLDARDIHVTASPARLTVRTESKNQHERDGENIPSSETGHKALLRNIELPEPINVGTTTARLENGILYLTATPQSGQRKPATV